jgi:hypothetical protein
LLAVLLFLASVTHLSRAAISAAVRVLAVAPPVPSFLIAAKAAAGTVREAWEVAPARTVATFVVLSTEAETVEATKRMARSFILRAVIVGFVRD